MAGSGALVIGLIILTNPAWATVTDTNPCDVTVASNTTSSDCTLTSGAVVSYIGSSDTLRQSSGTGLFDPFVRLQASPTEQGFNTDAPVTFDAKTGKWTHAIKVSAVPTVPCVSGGTALCWELFVDINENNTAKRVSLNDVQIWFTNSNTTTDGTGTTFTGFASPATLEYHYSGNILINDVNEGSGRGDLRYLVPVAGHTFDASTYFVLYSLWGTTSGTDGNFGTGGYSSDGGFEEWKVKKVPNVSIVKTADAATVNAGSNIGFTITVTNSGAADATGVTISDPLPAGPGVDWAESPDNPDCSISGSPPSETLNCGPVTLAAGGGSLSVHVQSATTAASCGTYNNTATFTSTNAGTGSSAASVVVQCGALLIKKNSTKSGNAVKNAGALFSVTGTASFTVRDNNTGTPAGTKSDESTTVGVVCVSGLAPGVYTVSETSPPSGYGPASGTQSVTVSAGTTCTPGTTFPGSGATATFTNPPLSDIQVRFRDGGSGETKLGSAGITCDNATGTPDNNTTTGWDNTHTVTGVKVTSSTITITCTIPIDP